MTSKKKAPKKQCPETLKMKVGKQTLVFGCKLRAGHTGPHKTK